MLQSGHSHSIFQSQLQIILKKAPYHPCIKRISGAHPVYHMR